jgi:hypothetical protein
MTQSIREVAPAGKWAVAELRTYIGWVLGKGSFKLARHRRIIYLALLD